MKSRGYTAGQIKAMDTINSLAGEYFDHAILVVKDNKKPFYWETVGDDLMIEALMEKAFDSIVNGPPFDEEDEPEFDGTPGYIDPDEEDED